MDARLWWALAAAIDALGLIAGLLALCAWAAPDTVIEAFEVIVSVVEVRPWLALAVAIVALGAIVGLVAAWAWLAPDADTDALLATVTLSAVWL